MHTAAKTSPQMQKKVANPKAIHGTTRMTVAGGFGIPSVSSGEVQQRYSIVHGCTVHV